MRLITPKVPAFNDLEKHIKEILDSKNLTTGKWVKKVEDKIKKIHGCKYCVLSDNATTSFMLLFKSVEKHYKFNSIYIQDFTWKSIKNILSWIYKGKVSYVDINKDNWLAEEPKNRDCLFIPNMTFGNVKTYKHDRTIYDSSHCIGNKECNGRGYGEIISFSPAKMISGCEGGCVITNKKKIYEEVLRLRRFHGRISELNALFLYYNLKNLTNAIKLKKNIDSDYRKGLNRYFQTWFPASNSFTTNEIVYVHPKMNDKKRKKLKKLFAIRQRYESTNLKNKNSLWVYNNQIVLPQVTGKEQEEVIKKLNESCPRL